MNSQNPSVAAWREFCEAMADAGELVLGPEVPDNPNVQAEGIRALSRYLTFALERCLERGDPTRPAFVDVQTPIRKYMGDNPDQTYFSAVVSGDRTYRIRASAAGTVAVEIGVYAGDFGANSGGRRLVSAVEDTSLRLDADGNYELLLTPDPDPADPNQLLLDPDSSSVLIRTYFTDLHVRLAHRAPTIEAIPAPEPTPMFTPEHLKQKLEIAALHAVGSFRWWGQFSSQGHKFAPVNTFAPLPDEGDIHTPENVRYFSGDWQLAPDEALVIDFDPSAGADYWGVVLITHWGETVYWLTRPTVINKETAARRQDGSVRIVVAHEDPGVPNWLDTAGHPSGSLSLRWFRSDAPLPTAQSRVVPVGQAAALD
ncbi:MAG: DUF1214 domain-containing protein [Acidimicrobiaceae bacterium]|nr:DUF1214 domain-containing protein [Acidimicrobiaceae bacterium]